MLCYHLEHSLQRRFEHISDASSTADSSIPGNDYDSLTSEDDESSMTSSSITATTVESYSHEKRYSSRLPSPISLRKSRLASVTHTRSRTGIVGESSRRLVTASSDRGVVRPIVQASLDGCTSMDDSSHGYTADASCSREPLSTCV